MRRLIRYILTGGCLFLIVFSSEAQNRLARYALGGGGRSVQSTSTAGSVTVGQPLIGHISSSTTQSNVGFQQQTSAISVENFPPYDITISANSLDENQDTLTFIALLSTLDDNQSDTHIYSFVTGTGGEDNGSFVIGEDTLLSNEIFNFELKDLYSIRIKTDDGKGGTYIETFTININDINDPPDTLMLSNNIILEGLPSGTTIGIFSTEDEDALDSHSYAFLDGAGGEDNTSFTLVGDTLKSAASFVYDTKNTYQILVEVEDENAGTFSKAFTITIEKGNTPPSGLTLSDSSIVENTAVETTIGTFSITDPDTEDVITYSLVAGTGDTDNASFSINGAELKNAAVFDFESNNSYSIRVLANDGEANSEAQVYTISVINENEAPITLTLTGSSLPENAAAGSSIGTLAATDPDTGETLTFSLPQGSGDNARFQLDGDTLQSAEIFDFENKSSYSILVRVTDSGELSIDEEFTISVTDVDEVKPQISSTTYPQFYDLGTGTKQLQITAIDNVGIAKVIVRHNMIGEIGSTEVELNSTNNRDYSFDFDDQLMNEIGFEYTFTASDAQGNSVTSSGETFLRYGDTNSPSISGLKFGTTVDKYQIISIPYELNSKLVENIFDELEDYDDSKWRLFHYQGNTDGTIGQNKEFNSFTTIELGAGYWLIAANSTTIEVGAGNTPRYTLDNPFEIQLIKGWNQIGNPYPFRIDWEDIRAANDNPGMVNDLYTSDDGKTFTTTSALDPFKGAFIQAADPYVLKIPPIKAGSSGRIAENEINRNNIDEDNWEVQFEMGVGEHRYSFGGIGMDPMSWEGFDNNDLLVLPPAFGRKLHLMFSNDGPQLTREIVSPQNGYIWEFTIETDLSSGSGFLAWDNSYFGNNETGLYLFDVESQLFVDMKKKDRYEFNLQPGHQFRLLYGDAVFIEENLLPSASLLAIPYPNPFTEEILIPFRISKEMSGSNVTIQIYDLQGQEVAGIVNRTMNSGYHEVVWNGKRRELIDAIPGMYVCVMTIKGKEDSFTFTRKLIKNR